MQHLETAEIFSEVLLIEDDPAHAKLIKRSLVGLVGEIRHAQSGKDGLHQIYSSYCELVLCDLHLPDANGLELLKNIRAARPGLPVIVLTSSGDIDIAVQAMREGASDFMVKNFTDDLSQRFRIVIDRIAERKLQQIREAHVRAERDAFWAATAAAQDGVAILGESGAVLFYNQAFIKFLTTVSPGATPTEKDPAEWLNLPAHLHTIDPQLAQSLRDELKPGSKSSLWSSEIKCSIKEGNNEILKYYELTLSSVDIESLGELAIDSALLPSLRKYVVWAKDITQKKEQERFQRDLLSTTSHDLKGPLGAIISSAELLTEMPDLRADKAQELITRIASCSRNCITLIDELLSARRIQDGVMIIKPSPLPANEVLEDIVLDYVPSAKAKSIEFYAKPAHADLNVYADRLGIRRVLSNLVSNALKFTPHGGKVVLEVERVGEETRISVTDTGPGIEAKDRHVLFEKYGRLEKHRGIDGTGLGLFVTKNIVAAHGGKIEVKSEVGVGTTFVVSLPLPPGI